MDYSDFFEKSVSAWKAFLLFWNIFFFLFIYLYYFSSFVFLGLSDWLLYLLAFIGFVPLYVGLEENIRLFTPVLFFLAFLVGFAASSFLDFIFLVYFFFSVFGFVFYEVVWKGLEERRRLEVERWESLENEKTDRWLDEIEQKRRLKVEEEVERRVAEVLSERGLGKVRTEKPVEKKPEASIEGDRLRREKRILTNIRRGGWVRVGDVMLFNECSKRTAVRDLNSLIDQRLIRRTGRSTGVIYVSSV